MTKTEEERQKAFSKLRLVFYASILAVSLLIFLPVGLYMQPLALPWWAILSIVTALHIIVVVPLALIFGHIATKHSLYPQSWVDRGWVRRVSEQKIE